MKKCQKCKKLKSIEDTTHFGICKSNKDGFQRACKVCRKSENKKRLEYYHNNKDSIKIQRKEYRNRPETKENREKYKKRRNELERKKRKENLHFRCYELMRTKFHKFVKGQKNSCINYLKCSKDFFREWIEFRFESWMNWDNQGSEWDFDHIIPVNSFDLKDDNQVKICFHWTNFQPLEKSENQKKSDKIELHYFMNNIINVNRFIQHKKSNFDGYQALRETLRWLREKN